VTVSKDRILAISGIAERFAAFVPKRTRYIAGLWESRMPQALFWYRCPSALSDRPVEYRGPSWSWVSIDDQVQTGVNDDCDCKVLSIEYALERTDTPYGAVSSAALHIEGPAFSIEWRYTRQDESPKEDLSEFRWRGEGYGEHGVDIRLFQHLDARERSTEWREIILLAQDRSAVLPRCVALIWVDQIEVNNKSRNRFRRLGAVNISVTDPDFSPVESWLTRSYYVI
jgi:hypothetical protein